jgi:ribosome-associated protein
MSDAADSRTSTPADVQSAAPSFAIAAARIAAENKAEEVRVLDLRELSSVADFFVLGTGTSDRQMHAVLNLIERHARTLDRRPFHVADSTAGTWLLADYVDVVIHLFDLEHRSYYDLDSLWGDAPLVEWEDPAPEVGRA